MKNRLIASVICCACLTLATTAEARTSYDGPWNLVFFTQRGGCDPTYNFSVNINDGIVTHPNLVKFRGYVAKSGAVRASVTVHDKYASGSGRLTADSGGGTWSGRAGGGRCSGYWTAQRSQSDAKPRLKYIVIGLFVCASLAGYLRQRPALPQSRASIFIDGGYLEPAAMVDASSPEVEKQTVAMDQRPARPLFGMETEPVLGPLTSKWRAVELEIGHEERALADCRAQRPCPGPARDLLKLIAEGTGRTGRARVGLINRAVVLAITPATDEAQWGVEDHWSSPFETLQTHRGDCEDYAIVKYVALRQAGLPTADVKIVILRNQFPNEYHAVAATRVNGEWLIRKIARSHWCAILT